ncbi:3D domain-containing protein [Psychrobacillus mangrovi]|uniref:3D domain-containing protein n=1 Tax=Psychrobacillus mangrovi TaxID=3117745 RepID=UPI0039B76D56
MKVRSILFVLLFVFVTNSVAHASELFNVATNEEELSISPDLIEERAIIEEAFYVHFQDALNLRAEIEVEPEPEPKTYTVVKGDNLYRIAEANNITLAALISWNGLTTDLIHPDDVLIVSGNEEDVVELAEFEPVKRVASSSNVETPTIEVSQPIVSAPPIGEGAEMVVTATAYTAYCEGCSGTTAYGIDLRANPDQKVIAVDPRIIPLGSKVWVEGYGEAIAGDTGGAIKGNKIDVFIPTYESAMQWGVKKVKIKVIN